MCTHRLYRGLRDKYEKCVIVFGSGYGTPGGLVKLPMAMGKSHIINL